MIRRASTPTRRPATVRRVVVATLLTTAAAPLVGCAAGVPAPPDPTPTSTSTPSGSPAPGTSLRDLGLTHGPVERVTLPPGVRVLERIDQPNVVTLLIEAEQGEEAAAHLAATLPAAGFTVTASVPGSLTFTGRDWDGAFTTSPEVAGLTLRARS